MTARKLLPAVAGVVLGLAIALLANTRDWSTLTVYAVSALAIVLVAIAAPLAMTRGADHRLRRYVRQKRNDPGLRNVAAAHAERMSTGEAYAVRDFINKVTKTGD